MKNKQSMTAPLSNGTPVQFQRVMPKIRSIIFSFVACCTTVFATERLAAQGLGTAISVGNKLDLNHEVQSFRVQPPFAGKMQKVSLKTLLNNKPALFLYLDIATPGAIDQLSAFETEANKAKKFTPVLVLFAKSGDNTDLMLNYVRDANFVHDVVIDSDQYFLTSFRAFRPPHYAALAVDGTLQINNVSQLDAKLQTGQTLRQAIGAANIGSNWPRSDGEKRESISGLVGSKPGSYKASLSKVGGDGAQTVSSDDTLTKPRLVVFWIATCPHCQREMPRIFSWWSQNKSSVELVTITRLERSTMVNYTQSYLAKKGLGTMPIYEGDEEDFKAFSVMGFPSWALVGKDGKIVSAREGEDPNLERTLELALSKAQ